MPGEGREVRQPASAVGCESRHDGEGSKRGRAGAVGSGLQTIPRLPKAFAALGALIAGATAGDMRLFVQFEGENMRLRQVELDPEGVRIRYGSSARGQYSTVLVEVQQFGRNGCLCLDEDEEEVVVWARGKPVRRMGVIPAEQPTGDDAGYVGRVFGNLTVLQTMGWKNRHRMALCICTCGGQKLARISSLRTSQVISCGCRRGKNTELPLAAGSVYGHLTVLMQVDRPQDGNKKEGYYRVRCVCGTEQIRGREDIVTPKQADCGCRGRGLLVGQRFGKLVILAATKKVGHQRLVLTRCDCGTESFARLGDLRSGKKKSCGCLRTAPRSKAETGPSGTVGE